MKRLFIVLLSTILLFSGCQQKASTSSPRKDPPKVADAEKAALLNPEEFIKKYNLKADPNPEKIPVNVPTSWEVATGEYPEGLYWNLVNEYSKG